MSTKDHLIGEGPIAPVVPGVLAMTPPPGKIRELFTDAEWSAFEAQVRRWLGEAATSAGRDGRVLCLDEALLVPSAYTYAVAVKTWMDRLDMPELADRISPADYSDTDAFTTREEN